ncbi:MAG: InlB B-repeat-containing protein [Clostridia bacterium]
MTMLRPDDEKPKVDTYRFYDADGTELTEWQQTVAAGDELLEPTAPKKDNARFVGWYDESDNLFEGFGKITSVTGGATVKLTAKFEDVRYVYFMNKDGSSVCYTAEGEAETAVSSSDLEAAKNTVNLMLDAESHVVGWSTVPNDDKATTVTFAKDKIVTKVYPVIESGFWVKFDTDGGSHVQSVFCEPGITLELSQVPTRSGYTFDGWYIDDQKVTSVSAEATVTARWKANSETEYTVIHWLENADDDEYSSEDIEEKTGATNSTTNAQAKSYSGFTAQAITQKTIAGDGSTIVNVYYKRNVYDVKFMKFTCNKEEHTHFFCGPWCNKEEHQHSEKCYTEITGLTIHAKYGANIRDKWPNKPESAWNVSTDGNTWQAGIDVMPLDGATFYQRGQNSSHTMVASYYLETISGGKYELDHQDTVYGQGDSVTKEDRYSITGFTLNEGKSTRIGRDYNGAKFYYDRNSYNIVFMNKGAEDSKVSRKYQQDISNANYKPNKPAGVPANFTFAGWYDNELCEGTAYDFTGKTMPAQNITLYAKWQAPQVNATVYLSASADSKSETFSVPYGKKITESEDFNAIIARIKAETGEAPSAWFVVTGEGRVLFDLDTPLYSSVTLYPFFASSSEGYTVTYKEEGTDEPAKDEQKYLTGSRAGILAPVNGENFRAWKTEDNKLIYPGDKITVTKNTTLTAVYTNKPQTVTIKYHYNFTDKDGNYNDATFKDGNHPKNTNAIVKSLGDVGFKAPIGYEFRGWATARDSNKIEYVEDDPVFVDANGDNDLYAVWQVKTYTVTWKNDDGSVLRTDKNVEYGTMPNYGANPTKAADAQYTYTFKGWTPKVKTVTGDAVYTAVYDKAVNKYTVTWKNDDGSILRTDKNVEYGTMPNYGANPTKAVDAQYTYTFKGWTPKVKTVTGDATYQATYTKEANTYTLTYDLDGGEWTEATNEFPYEYKATVEVIKTVPTREGYKFSGWRSEEVTIENDAFTMPAKDVVLKAVWEANPTPTPIPSEEPTPTPAPTEEPTPTPAPTEEPTPTPAPTEEPTPTPAPTEEPTPTPAPTGEPTPTPAPNPNPNPATPTPTPVAPVVPATVATPTPKPTATPSTTPSDNGGKGDGNNDGETGETINDNETPLANGEDIADNATPLAGLGTGAWALINLILTIVTTLLSILLLIGYIGKKKKALEDEDGNVVLDENGKEVMEYEKNKKGLWRLISIIPALIAIIVFIFTEDMTLPMIFVDKWTILHVVIALVQVVVMVLCKKKKDENDEDENAANA